MRKKKLLPSMRLSTQILVSTIIVLFAAASIAFIAEVRFEYAHMNRTAQQQVAQTTSLVGKLVSEPVAAEDAIAVRSLLRDAVTSSPVLEHASVLDRAGNLIAAFPDTPSGDPPALSEYRAALEHEGRQLGQIVMQWTVAPSQIRAEDRIASSVLFMSAILIAIGLLFRFLVMQVALRPLSGIQSNMAAVLRREQISQYPLPRFAARELAALSESVGSLERILQERDRREADLRAAHIAVDAANQSKSKFLASMSHEIRTPINGVLGMAELLLDTKLNHDQRVYAETIAKSAASLIPIINDILDFSKMEAGKLALHPKPFDLNRMIEDFVTMISGKAYQKEVEINFRYDPRLPTCFIGDDVRIRQILTNIVGNAVKFTLEGHVLIDVKGHSEGDRTALTLEVSDTGIGIPANKIEHIFDEFEQSGDAAGRQFEGTGLGLAISNKLIRLMGGSIDVRSEAGKGSVFTIRLNLEETDEIEPVSLADTRDLVNRTVLIVDDMQINRTILSERLRNWGVRHKAVSSGPEALEVLKAAQKSGVNFDAIIVDYHMPEMNGCELAANIRKMEHCGSAPIILLSSVDVACEPLSENPSIFEIYLLKPVRSDTLKAVLANAISKKGTSKMPEPDNKETPTHQSALSGKTILIAEDNKTNQLVLQTMLKTLNVEIITAEDGRQALETYITRAPDLVLMDMAMPVLDGLEATQKIREFEERHQLARTPIIALTANAMTGDRDNCLNAGMDDYLSKPVIKSNLVATMEKWVIPEPDTATAGQETKALAPDGGDDTAKAS